MREPADPERVPILLDVDTGIDDALALLYACASPEADVIAVTCTAGNVDAPQVVENTLAVLELGGRPDVEVALGRGVPLVRELRTAPETHGPRGLGYAELPPARSRPSSRHAVDIILDAVATRPGELTIVTLGPLTNLALAVLREPELPRLVRRLVVMGGSYRSPGNTAPTSEWNIAVDPEAARLVFTAFGAEAVGSRPLALGLDVTERAKFTPGHLERLADRARDRAARPGGAVPAPPIVAFVDDALRFYMEFHSRFDGFYGAFIHDPLALAVALDPSLARSEPLTVDIELAGTLTAGETVADWRRVWGKPPNVDVVMDVDVDVFMDRFIDRVGDLARAPVSREDR